VLGSSKIDVKGVKMAELLKGPVKWFNDAKGFGFIEHTTGKDVFVHYSVIEWDGFKTLKDGEEVEYELKAGEKGLHAARVIRLAALEKKLQKQQMENHLLTDTEVAPNLQSGNVSAAYKPSNKMVEVETREEEEGMQDEVGSMSLVEKEELQIKELND
jgi:CspA family cold shock protein